MAAERYSVAEHKKDDYKFRISIAHCRTLLCNIVHCTLQTRLLHLFFQEKTHLLPCIFVKTFLSPFCHFLIFLIVSSFQDSMRLFDVRSNFLLKAFSYPPIKKIFPVRRDGQVDSVLLQIFTRPLWIVTLFCFMTRPTFPCIIDPLFWRLSIRITLNLITEK